MWYYNNKEFKTEDIPEGAVGFVYEIYCKPTNQFYIGRKKFFSTLRKPPLKGKVKKRKIIKDSDWQNYYGSSEEMQNLRLTYGTNCFIRKVLRICFSLSELSYFETKFIFETDALLRDDYINKWLSARINGRNLKGVFHGKAKEKEIRS